MKRKTPMMKRWFALLLAGLLMATPAVLAEEEDGAGFGTFFQPEGVELCEVEDAGSLSVPDGLSGLYALMQDCNPFASAYVFRMPKGRALMSVACTTIGNPKTALELLENTEFKVKVLRLPQRLVDGQYVKQDADDFIKFQGKDAFEHLLSGSESGMDFRMAQLGAKFDLKSDEGRIGYGEAAANLLAAVPNAVEREIYTVRAAEAAGITPEAMKLEVERARKRAHYKEKREQERRDLNPAVSAQPRERSIRYTDLRSALAEEGVLRLLTLDDSLFGEDPPIREADFSSPLLGRFFTALRTQLRETGQVSLPALAEFFTQEEINHLIGILQKPESLKNGAQALHDYSTIILEQAHKRASAGEDPLAAAMEKNKHKGNGGKQPWKKNS